jgi:hypothetical protein
LANLWVDGFEGYGVMAEGYRYLVGTGTHAGPGGRGGGQAASGTVTAGPFNIITGTTVILGYAEQTGRGSVSFVNGTNQNVLSITVDAFGRLVGTWRPETGGVTLFTVTPPMRLLGVWRYYEHKFMVIDATHISYELRIDELVVIPMATYTIPAVATTPLITVSPGGTVDDFYINDDIGAAPDNDYWGDTRMFALRPNGDVAVTWTPSPSGGGNYVNVDDTPGSDGDTTHNETSTIGAKDEFSYQDTGLPAGTVIRTVAVMTSARRLSDSGPRAIQSYVKHSGVEVTGAYHQLSDSYYMEQLRVPHCPSTGAAWTPAEVDAATGSYELVE